VIGEAEKSTASCARRSLALVPEDAGSIPATSTEGCSRFYAVDAHESHDKKRSSPQTEGWDAFLVAQRLLPAVLVPSKRRVAPHVHPVGASAHAGTYVCCSVKRKQRARAQSSGGSLVVSPRRAVSLVLGATGARFAADASAGGSLRPTLVAQASSSRRFVAAA